MKIAVTSEGPLLESRLDPRFGRAKYFLFYDTETGEYEFYDNEEGANALQGAGIQSAELVVNRGAQVVITGHCGPKAFRALKEAGVEVYYAGEGTVRDAIDALARGELSLAQEADVPGHW